MFGLWNKKSAIDYLKLVRILERGQEDQLKQLLPHNDSISFLPVTFDMLQKLRKPANASESLSILQTHTKGDFDLVIFNAPWHASDLPYSPLIVNRSNGLVYGIMQPFNELRDRLSKRQASQISYLSILWTRFIMGKRFGVYL